MIVHAPCSWGAYSMHVSRDRAYAYYYCVFQALPLRSKGFFVAHTDSKSYVRITFSACGAVTSMSDVLP